MPRLNDNYSSNNQRILSKALTIAGIDHLQKQCLYADYYPDFVFPGHKLVVEVDSSKNTANSANKAEQETDTQERDSYLNELGYQVVRYSNQAVKNCTKGVVLSIQRYLTTS